MARFRALIKGQRGMVSRLGSEKSGLNVVANGWNSGVRVVAGVDSDGKDSFDLYMTGGSNSGRETYIGTVAFGAETGDLLFIAPNADFVAAA